MGFFLLLCGNLNYNAIIMNSKIQELTDLIYNEGVAKGQDQADKLVEEAKARAAQIVADAKKESEQIIAAAKKNATECAENTQKELKLYASQALSALKSQIADVVTDKIVSRSVEDFTSDKDQFFKFLMKMAEGWSEKESLVISTADADSLKNFFLKNAKQLLDKGVEIRQVNGMKTAVSISPADGSYKVDFGPGEFENYFKSFLRPQLVETLF